MLGTRRHLKKFINDSFTVPLDRAIVKFVFSLFFASIIAFLPHYPGLEINGVFSLFILLFAAGLWITEAIPAFSVSLHWSLALISFFWGLKILTLQIKPPTGKPAVFHPAKCHSLLFGEDPVQRLCKNRYSYGAVCSLDRNRLDKFTVIF